MLLLKTFTWKTFIAAMLTKTMPRAIPQKPFSKHCSAIFPTGFIANHIIRVTEITQCALKEQIVSIVFNPIDLSSNALLQK